MVRKILVAPNPKLNQQATAVTANDKHLAKLVKDLEDTLATQTNPEGVGLAAPQIGVLKRVFIVLKGGKYQAIINPRVVRRSKKTNYDARGLECHKEGCLSVPGVYCCVERPEKIKVEYLTGDFEQVSEVLVGLAAQVFLHELDHLDGILFTQRVVEANPSFLSRSDKSLLI